LYSRKREHALRFLAKKEEHGYGGGKRDIGSKKNAKKILASEGGEREGSAWRRSFFGREQ